MSQAETVPVNDTEPRVPFVDLRAHHESLRAEIDEAIGRVVSNCNFILGGEVAEFEAAFASFCGTRHAIGVSSGLDALSLALKTAGVGPGDEVILPANTFIATALAVSEIGAQPVLVDCEPVTFNIDVERVADAITDRTRALLPVHLTGHPAEMEGLLELAQRHDLKIIEDAAQAHGATYHGQPAGGLGDFGCFSFYPSKNLGALGDAGMITTNDDDAAERLRMLRNYGSASKYDHVEMGANRRMDTLQAAVLKIKLERLPDWNAARASRAARYVQGLTGVGDLVLPRCLQHATHVYHLFMLRTARRDELRDALDAVGIDSGIHYPVPVHLQPAYRQLGYRAGDFAVAEQLAGEILSLPMYPEMTDQQVDRVVDAVRNFFR